MEPSELSVTFATNKIAETRDFYEQYFDAKASFDCGWYVLLKLGGKVDGQEVGLMEPQNGATLYSGGATLNLMYSDVDAIHTELTKRGVVPIIPLEDHPWGDRGFAVMDPLGTTVYCLTPIEASDEFRKFQVDLS
jgi:catechol 2,3-dioxygenase-like lactoylglutathione lyase family enzyme